MGACINNVLSSRVYNCMNYQQWVHEGLYSYSKKYEEHTSVSNTELK